jgi:hypothetical protein
MTPTNDAPQSQTSERIVPSLQHGPRYGADVQNISASLGIARECMGQDFFPEISSFHCCRDDFYESNAQTSGKIPILE